MNKDIPYFKVQDLVIAVVPRMEVYKTEDDIELWDTYLINLKDEAIKNVFVSSKGYGYINGEEHKTTTLRHFFVEIGPRKAVQIEPIQTTLFELTNEYWVSFVYQDYMYDKKYVFVIGSIVPSNFTKVPLIERKGVMIR
ncbi:MAG: hypothetical protein HC892_08450 [Saprospiraceae bacterium]|nr:hypothetical protein [Saprospiraceae bacterium]